MVLQMEPLDSAHRLGLLDVSWVLHVLFRYNLFFEFACDIICDGYCILDFWKLGFYFVFCRVYFCFFVIFMDLVLGCFWGGVSS